MGYHQAVMWLVFWTDFQECQDFMWPLEECGTNSHIVCKCRHDYTPIPAEEWEWWEGNLGSGVRSKSMKNISCPNTLNIECLESFDFLSALCLDLLWKGNTTTPICPKVAFWPVMAAVPPPSRRGLHTCRAAFAMESWFKRCLTLNKTKRSKAIVWQCHKF